MIGVSEADFNLAKGAGALHLGLLAKSLAEEGSLVTLVLDERFVASPAGIELGRIANCGRAEPRIETFASSHGEFLGVSPQVAQAGHFARYLQSHEGEFQLCCTTGLGALAYFAALSRHQGIAHSELHFVTGGFELGASRFSRTVGTSGSAGGVDILALEERLGEIVDDVIGMGALGVFDLSPQELYRIADRGYGEQPRLRGVDVAYLLDGDQPELLRLYLECHDAFSRGMAPGLVERVVIESNPFLPELTTAVDFLDEIADRRYSSGEVNLVKVSSIGLALEISQFHGLLVCEARDPAKDSELVIARVRQDASGWGSPGSLASRLEEMGSSRRYPDDLARETTRALALGSPGGGRAGISRQGDLTPQWVAVLIELAQGTQGSAKAGKFQAPVETPMVSICVIHRDRSEVLGSMLASLERQDYPSAEVILVDDGSVSEESLSYLDSLGEFIGRYRLRVVKNSHAYKGVSRNLAAELASSDYLIFMDCDNMAKANELSTLMRVAQFTGADLVTSSFDYTKESIYGDELDQRGAQTYLPIGGSPVLALFHNNYGDTNSLIRKSAFATVGGFDSSYGARLEDWELHLRIALSGLKQEVVFEPLFWYRLGSPKGRLYQLESRHALAKRISHLLSYQLDPSDHWLQLAVIAELHDKADRAAHKAQAEAAPEVIAATLAPEVRIDLAQEFLILLRRAIKQYRWLGRVVASLKQSKSWM